MGPTDECRWLISSPVLILRGGLRAEKEDSAVLGFSMKEVALGKMKTTSVIRMYDLMTVLSLKFAKILWLDLCICCVLVLMVK